MKRLPIPLPVRKLAAGLVSTLVVLGMSAYVLVDPTTGVQLGVEEVSGDLPYDAVADADYTLASAQLLDRRRWRQTVYGVVRSPAGVPVAKARLVIKGVGKRVRKHGASIRLPAVDTTYRTRIRVKPGRYRFTITLRAGGQKRSATKVVRVRNRHAYRASATVHESGVITMLPITSY